MTESEIITQIDFSGGQINASALRRDDLPATTTGGLEYSNFRAEAQGTALSRPGRTAIYAGYVRSDFVRMSAAHRYHVHFPPGGIVITDTSGNSIASSFSASYLWTNATVSQVSFALGNFMGCVCFPGMQPVVMAWSPSTQVWTFTPFTWSIIGGNYQEPFYRFNVPGAYMSWSTTTGAYAAVGAVIPLTCSQSYFTAAMIGSVLSILGGQVQIQSVTSPTVANVVVLSRLPDTVVFAGINPTGFSIGQIAEATNSGMKIEIIATNTSALTVTGPLLSGKIMTTVGGAIADTLSSPNASSATSGFSQYFGASGGNTATIQWQEEFMSPLQGWPASVSFGNDRFIFCNFPQRQEAILWTAIGTLTNAYIDSVAAEIDQSAGASASSAILEYIDNRPTVFNVVDTGDEFIFTDKGVYFIPLAVSGTGLKPGSVAFRLVTNDGCSPVRPVPLLQTIIYANSSGNRISMVNATGSITLPYSSQDMTDIHSDLFNNPVCITVTPGDTAPERLVYVVNADGSVVVGRAARQTGVTAWHPEPSGGFVSWVTANVSRIWFNTLYSGGYIVEVEDPTQYLDCAVTYNSIPANLAPPLPSPVNPPSTSRLVSLATPSSGLGPLWWMAGGLVTLADNGFDLGDRSVDATGHIIHLPGAHDGITLASPTVVVGAPIAKVWQPSIPRARPGPSKKQRMHRRSIKRALITVERNCEFTWGSTLVSAYNFQEDQSQAPVFGTMNVRTRPLGRNFDPGIALQSARFGQIRILEFSAEVTT